MWLLRSALSKDFRRLRSGQYRWELILKFDKPVGLNNHVGRNFSKCDKYVCRPCLKADSDFFQPY